MAFKDPNVGAATQFKPGESGNLAGKPKGTKHIATWINEMLNDEEFTATIREGLQITQYKGAPMKAIVRAHMHLALAGDVRAADMLFKHAAPQKLLLGNDPDNPLTGNRELTEQELRDRLSQIVAGRETGSDSNTIGTGQAQSQD